VSHRIHRGTLVPIVAGLFAVLVAALVVAGPVVAGPAAIVAHGSTGTAEVRGQEWWLSSLDVPSAWHVSKGAGVTVAVLSTGVSPSQPDLAGDVTTGPDYSASGRVPGGPYWGVVGTAVASVIAGHGHGTGDNSGIIGIAPSAKILSVRVTLEYNDPLNGTPAITQQLPGAIADGIVYAADHGAKVIDLPLDPGTFGLAGDSAGAGGSAAEQSAVKYALAKGAVLVAPAGDNEAISDQVNYPAAYPGVIAVGAVTRDDSIASFSSRHSYVSLTAPGVDLMAASMLPAQGAGYVPGYAPISTTSAASGLVAGVATLVVSKYPQLMPGQVAQALRSSATGATATVNAAGALHAASLLVPSPKPAAPKPVPAPPNPVQPPAAGAPAASHTTAATLVHRWLRDIVLGLCALTLLLAIGALVTRVRTRRKHGVVDHTAPKGAAQGGQAHGQHEQRKNRGRDGLEEQAATASLRQAARPGSPAASGRPAASAWPAESGHSWDGHSWDGQSPAGQSSAVHSASNPNSSRPQRPLLGPVPDALPRAGRDVGSPPWEVTGKPAGKREGTAADGHPGSFGGPDLTAPFAGRDVLTQASFGFAAAPVASDYPMPASPDHAGWDSDDDEPPA
jgi:Subtilase family